MYAGVAKACCGSAGCTSSSTSSRRVCSASAPCPTAATASPPNTPAAAAPSNRRLPDPDPHARAAGLREAGCAEYLHPWSELVGGLCRAGFVVEDLTEPDHADPRAPAGSPGHRARFLPPYVRIKARRVKNAAPPAPRVLLP